MAEQKNVAAKPLSNQLKFWFGIGDFGFNLMTNVETFYFNAFMTNVAGFSTALAGTVATVASTIDACLSWIYGGIIDAVKPGKYGRYRTWMIMIPWIVPFLYAFQFLNLSSNQTVSAVIICVAAVVSHVVWNFAYVANATMVSVAGGTPEGRAMLSSSRGTWNNLASVIFTYFGQAVTVVVADWLGAQGYQYAACAFVAAVVVIVGYVVHFKITDGYEEIEDANAPRAKQKQTTPKDMAVAIFGNKYLLMLIIVDLAKWIVKFLVSSAAIYYFSYAMGTKLFVNYGLLANLMGVAGAFAARFVMKKVSAKGSMIASFTFMAALMVISYFSFANPTLVFVLMVVAQFGYGIAYATSPALYADTAVYAKWKSGKDSTGFIMGLQNVPLKAGVMVKSVILNVCLGLAGYDAVRAGIADGSITADMLDATLKQGVCGAFALWPALFLIVGLVILLVFYKLDNKAVNQYQAEIDARV